MLVIPTTCVGARLVGYGPIAENDEVDVDRLRAETRKEHEAVEALVPLMDADLTLEQYVGTLRRMNSVVHGWESWAAAHAPAEFQALLAERRRSHLLHEDLAFFGAVPASESSVVLHQQLTAQFLKHQDAQDSSPPDFLGAMYVMEGSTLGGQHIARHVEEKLGLCPGIGNAYFRGYGENTGSMWRGFKQLLITLPDSQTERVIAAARFMFRAFGEAMSSTPDVAANPVIHA